MLTPLFKVDQDDEFVTLELKCPYVKAQNVEFFINECEFKFFVAPYFLRLNFPHPIIENGKESATYDIGQGLITVKLPKLVPGTNFPDLEMLSKLMMPKATAPVRPTIEVMGEDNAMQGTMESGDEEEEEDMIGSIIRNFLNLHQIRVNQSYSGFASHVQEIGRDIIDIQDLDHPLRHREMNGLEMEESGSAKTTTCGDFVNDDEVQRVIKFKPESGLQFTASEREALINLPRKTLLIENPRPIYLGLVDILFAYCYDLRVTEGEHNVESPWTIAKICSTLSCFEVRQILFNIFF
ncbi:SHQ1 protein-domain-containing protein [Chytridium lagenaria]|nr:SHQ1 protein-domain-containing protein [Chytridium lagenaria]